MKAKLFHKKSISMAVLISHRCLMVSKKKVSLKVKSVPTPTPSETAASVSGVRDVHWTAGEAPRFLGSFLRLNIFTYNGLGLVHARPLTINAHR